MHFIQFCPLFQASWKVSKQRRCVLGASAAILAITVVFIFLAISNIAILFLLCPKNKQLRLVTALPNNYMFMFYPESKLEHHLPWLPLCLNSWDHVGKMLQNEFSLYTQKIDHPILFTPLLQHFDNMLEILLSLGCYSLLPLSRLKISFHFFSGQPGNQATGNTDDKRLY